MEARGNRMSYSKYGRKDVQPRILYPVKSSLNNEGKIQANRTEIEYL